MGRILDWLDEISGYDRTGIRVLLGIAAAWVLVIGAEWAINEAFFSGPSELCVADPGHRLCGDPDALEAETQQWIEDFNPEQFIDEVLRESR